jgi:hypothetical protein
MESYEDILVNLIKDIGIKKTLCGIINQMHWQNGIFDEADYAEITIKTYNKEKQVHSFTAYIDL